MTAPATFRPAEIEERPRWPGGTFPGFLAAWALGLSCSAAILHWLPADTLDNPRVATPAWSSIHRGALASIRDGRWQDARRQLQDVPTVRSARPEIEYSVCRQLLAELDIRADLLSLETMARMEPTFVAGRTLLLDTAVDPMGHPPATPLLLPDGRWIRFDFGSQPLLDDWKSSGSRRLLIGMRIESVAAEGDGLLLRVVHRSMTLISEPTVLVSAGIAVDSATYRLCQQQRQHLHDGWTNANETQEVTRWH